MSIVGKSQLSKQGFICLAGPYAAHEMHLIPTVVADAVRANKDVQVEETRNGAYIWHRTKLGR
jgi:hypothetical protein